jgi:hypothetical protein
MVQSDRGSIGTGIRDRGSSDECQVWDCGGRWHRCLLENKAFVVNKVGEGAAWKDGEMWTSTVQ